MKKLLLQRIQSWLDLSEIPLKPKSNVHVYVCVKLFLI